MIKTEKEGIVKERDGILLNVDSDGLAAYKKRKQMNKVVGDLQKKVDAMEDKLDKILDLLSRNN